MTIKNKLLTIIVVFVFALGIFFVAAGNTAYADDSCGNGLSWEVNGTKLTISGNGYMTDFYDYDYAPWYYTNGQYSYKNVTEIEVKEGVKSIGNYAFCYFSKIEKLVLPSSIERIGYEAFYECENLKEISIYGNVEDDAFVYCYALNKVAINGNCETIGEEAFSECYDLEYLSLPSSLRTVKSEAFDYDTKIKEVTYTGTGASYRELNVDTYDNDYLIEALNSKNGRKLIFKAEGDYQYVDNEGNQKTVTGEKYILHTGVNELRDGWYIVDYSFSYPGGTRLQAYGKVNILLCDGCEMIVDNGIGTNGDCILSIYSQHIDTKVSNTMGKLKMSGNIDDALLGANNLDSQLNASIRIYGGTIEATSNAVSIGCGSIGVSYDHAAMDINIYNGCINVTSNGSKKCAIGGTNGGIGAKLVINIFGGVINAQGGESAPAIGGYYSSGRVKITGGDIIAKTSGNAPAIGGVSPQDSFNIYISGGTIDATAEAVAIGGRGKSRDPATAYSIYISGGKIKAKTAGANNAIGVCDAGTCQGEISGGDLDLSNAGGDLIYSNINVTGGRIPALKINLPDTKNSMGRGSMISTGSLVIIICIAVVAVAAIVYSVIRRKRGLNYVRRKENS